MATTELMIEPRPVIRRRSRSPLVWVLIAFLVAGFFATRNVATWPARLGYPGAENWEGVALAEMVRLRRGAPIYAAGADQSFDAATYGPVYYLLGSHLVNPNKPSYFLLRLLSALGIIGCAAGCGLLAFWLGRSRLAAFLAPLVFLSYAMATGYGVVALSDGVALFLFFAGFLVAYRFRNRRAILLAAPLMLLGFYYKPQYVAGPLAVFAFLLLEKRYRRAAEFAGILVLGGLGMFAFFQWVAFPGQVFWRHFLLYQTSLLSWQLLVRSLVLFAAIVLPSLVLVVDYLQAWRDRMLTCYLIFAVLLGLFTFCKAGSETHYFFESVLLISAIVPALLAKRIAKHAGVLDVVVLLAVGLVAGQWFTRPTPRPADFVEYYAVQSYLRHHFPSRARSLGTRQGVLLQAGLETPFSGLFQLTQLARRGIVSDYGLVAQVRGHKFAVIVLNIDLGKERDPYLLGMFLTRHVRDAIKRDYKLQTSLAMPAPARERPQDRFYIYVPDK